MPGDFYAGYGGKHRTVPAQRAESAAGRAIRLGLGAGGSVGGPIGAIAGNLPNIWHAAMEMNRRMAARRLSASGGGGTQFTATYPEYHRTNSGGGQYAAGQGTTPDDGRLDASSLGASGDGGYQISGLPVDIPYDTTGQYDYGAYDNGGEPTVELNPSDPTGYAQGDAG